MPPLIVIPTEGGWMLTSEMVTLPVTNCARASLSSDQTLPSVNSASPGAAGRENYRFEIVEKTASAEGPAECNSIGDSPFCKRCNAAPKIYLHQTTP
ncbi:hypothetical protein BJY04DRAFT_82370 [Aspergillus karnatakaensis]|uniref:uncharacterized protein n=1 Tax=Aspergillus karnatakaensis TaxID=1810916 RepID=UPI003CCE34C5